MVGASDGKPAARATAATLISQYSRLAVEKRAAALVTAVAAAAATMLGAAVDASDEEACYRLLCAIGAMVSVPAFG